MRASVIDPAYLLMTEEKLRRFRWCVEELVLWKAIKIAREELKYEELGRIEYFEMVPSAGQAGPSKEFEAEEDTEAETIKRERNYWVVAIRPELWLLEELTYEP
jgi:hypothetical protein